MANELQGRSRIEGSQLQAARSAVLHALNEEISAEIVEVACDLVNIPSPTGEEQRVGEYLAARFRKLGMSVAMQEVESTRNNMIAHLNPNSPGPSIMFNGNMDTSTSGRESLALPIGLLPNAVIEDGWLYGLGASNMKAAFSAYYGAIRLIQAAGIEVAGRVTVSGVVGEIEKAPVTHYQGAFFRGGGCGANYGVQHGLMADVVVIGDGDDEPALVAVERNRKNVVALGEFARHDLERGRIDHDLGQIDRLQSQLLRQRVAQRRLGHEAEVHEQFSDRLVGLELLQERDPELILREDALRNQDLPDVALGHRRHGRRDRSRGACRGGGSGGIGHARLLSL